MEHKTLKTVERLKLIPYFDKNIDIHHIFPKKWCIDNQIEIRYVNCIVNKTPISSRTNREIGRRAPSDYIQRMQNSFVDSHELDEILRSHSIEPWTLYQDDFSRFFYYRFEEILKNIERAMGKQANRSPDQNDNPFADKIALVQKDYEAVVRELIASGEDKYAEFKSTGRKNLHTYQKDPVIEWSIIKSIAAFMNTDGGRLLIGIADNGDPVGIEEDYPFTNQTRDGWEQWLTNLIGKTLGRVEATETSMGYCNINDKTLACVEVTPAQNPVFATPIKSAHPKGRHVQGAKEIFYVRTGNVTQELTGNDALNYQKNRWPN